MTSTPQPDQDRRTHARRIGRLLARAYPDASCSLRHSNAFELLVATILSAQCTDDRVNQVTPALFAVAPSADSLAALEVDQLESLIRSTGFYRAKAKNLIGMARALVDRHGGTVPKNLEALTALPGVGRKTAHVVLGTAFKVPSGVVVDTHVRRLARRLGLTDADDPDRIERDLAALFPRSAWIALSHRLIDHGRAVCQARSPRCPSCTLAKMCPKVGVL